MKYKLPRTGKAPLEFEGEKLALASTGYLRGKEQNRWYEIDIYKAVAGTGDLYVAHVQYRTQWQGELDFDWADSFNDTTKVSEYLEQIDPIPSGAGFPPRKEFDDRQLALRMDLISQYRYAVSKVLEDFPEVL